MKTLNELITENTIEMVSFNTTEIAKQFDEYHQNLEHYKLIINLNYQPSQYWNNTLFLFIDDCKLPDNVYFYFDNNIGKSLTINNTNINDFETYKDELKKLFNLTNAEVIADLTKNFNDESFETKKDSLIADINNFEI